MLGVSRYSIAARVGLTYAALTAANVAAWGWAFLAFSHQPTLLGAAVLAYAFGLRHAFDADHIAAIDNVVRKLMQEGEQPYSVGFFFSLGHSTVVVLASAFLASAAAALKGRLGPIHEVGGLVGTSVSAAFLLAVGIMNLFILKGVCAAFDRVRRDGRIVEADLDVLLAGHGLATRLFRPAFAVVSRSWHMYPIGLLFGLGFDTATEIGLLGISAAQAARGMSLWTILVFPALFTAGMSLMDLTDSVLMTRAYAWAFVKPIRKLWYNLTLTAASVAVAIFIGGVEALGLIGGRLKLQGAFWHAIGLLNGDLGDLGFGVAAIFIAAWAISATVYRAKGYDGQRTEQPS